ncbi:hypothetical protein NLM33_37435 [Bradyrhizobium sp. CCGUVB1N3]|uniref:hypothetical protein n=1 Tax=Bradyrhizobium sp. CCGUVB1N3 TaxID=2949629 RepID=UPI0020B2F2EC|nr:hypothetical protein [Bradyrhizobium sp. CCGUVB1N3]MCP3475926.1 hypothetical protein [Bradyrhizobium sp. CCGUVB1N3]
MIKLKKFARKRLLALRNSAAGPPKVPEGALLTSSATPVVDGRVQHQSWPAEPVGVAAAFVPLTHLRPAWPHWVGISLQHSGTSWWESVKLTLRSNEASETRGIAIRDVGRM